MENFNFCAVLDPQKNISIEKLNKIKVWLKIVEY